MSSSVCKHCVLQIVAYNKMDVPESSVFWEDVQEALVSQGMTPERIIPISAATGSGVTVSNIISMMIDDNNTRECCCSS
jgi:hypothetical protein